MADWKIWESIVAYSAIRKVQPSWIEKANGNEKIRWLENLLFFCCIHRTLMKNADSQTKMLKIRHLTYEIISQIKKFRRVLYSTKIFFFQNSSISLIIYGFFTFVNGEIEKKHNINSFSEKKL